MKGLIVFLLLCPLCLGAGCIDFSCSFDNGDTCFSFGAMSGSPLFIGSTITTGPAMGIPTQSGAGMALFDSVFNNYYRTVTAGCLTTVPGLPTMGLTYCEPFPVTPLRGPFTYLGGSNGNFGNGQMITTPFEPYTVVMWLYFDVNVAMQTAANLIAPSHFNGLGGSRLSVTNSVVGARDFVFSFHFPSISNPNGCLFLEISNNAVGRVNPLALNANQTKVACISGAGNPPNPGTAQNRWYRLETAFSASGGVLRATMNFRNHDASVSLTVVRSDPADVIATVPVQGNGYLWFPFNSFAPNTVALDSVSMFNGNTCNTE